MTILPVRSFVSRAFWLLLCFVVVAQGRAGDAKLWQKQSIYQIITDRFYDGDPSNNNADGNYDPAGHTGTSVHGGDFKGIEQKLDYIKTLGATAIWISPIVLNVRGEFHGYSGYDFAKVDPHWGSLADLQHLIQAAHSKGILVIDDIVVNHGGNLVDSDDPGYPHFKAPPQGYQMKFRRSGREYPPPFDLNAINPSITNLFHNNGFTDNYEDPQQVQLGELKGLDDFRTESPYVRKQMTKIYQDWIVKAGFDGYRIDTVKHVELDFWQDWCPAIHQFAAANGKPNFFMFGEILHHSDAVCASYVGTNGGGAFKLDSALDYPLYFKMRSALAKANGNTKQIADHYEAVTKNYDPAARMNLVTFLDNHDKARFLSHGEANDDLNRLKTALVFLYTAQGIPCLYYGTEQAFDGETDPFDREDMFAGQFKDGTPGVDSFDMTHPMFQWTAKLNNFRRLYPALQTGIYTTLCSDSNSPGLFAFSRRLGKQEIIVVLNTAIYPKLFTNCPTKYLRGTVLVNLLDGDETLKVLEGSQLSPVSMAASSAKIFLAQSQVLPLDPVVTNISPGQDARGVKVNSPLVIQFSQPMDVKSVEAAFSTVPAMAGAIEWTSHHDTLTFTPTGQGASSQTELTVRITDTARAENSKRRFIAAFESKFRTQ